jgi:hypothetical protein
MPEFTTPRQLKPVFRSIDPQHPSLSGAEAVLPLRALRSSHDFDAYWKFHEEQEYKRNHASHYAHHHVPSVVLPAALLSQPSRRGTLKIVKKKGES